MARVAGQTGRTSAAGPAAVVGVVPAPRAAGIRSLADLASAVRSAALLRARSGLETGPAAPDLSEVLVADQALVGQAAQSLSAAVARLASTLGLTETESALLWVALAPEVDLRFAAAYGQLTGVASMPRPTAALALELVDLPATAAHQRHLLSEQGRLRASGVLQLEGGGPFLLRELRVADRVVAAVQGDLTLPLALLAAHREPVTAGLDDSEVLAAALRAGEPLSWVHAPLGRAGLSYAAEAIERAGAQPLCFDLAAFPSLSAETLRSLVVEAVLRRAVLVVLHAEAMTEQAATLLPLLLGSPVPVVAVSAEPWRPAWLARAPFLAEAPAVSPQARQVLWQQHLGPEVDVAALGAMRLAPDDVVRVADLALRSATAADSKVDAAEVRRAVSRLSAGHVKARGGTSATLEDLVLPELAKSAIEELISWGLHRDEVLASGSVQGKGGKGSGIAALFAGNPGTGKTLAAHVVADALGLDLYQVDLSTVVDKYIGETEKKLERIFHEAESLNVVLFFDEADSLFGSRSEVKDSRDRYANLEVSYLLQRMESFDGIVVLATNLKGNLDVAFARRLHFVVHFPDPDPATRAQLWLKHLGEIEQTDPSDPVDVELLSSAVELAGGDIRNVVLAAAYAAAGERAPVGMRHVVHGVLREFRKLGRRPPAQFT